MDATSSAKTTQQLKLHSLPNTAGRRALRATADWPARVLRDRRPVAVRRHAARLVKRLGVLAIADSAAIAVAQLLVVAAVRAHRLDADLAAIVVGWGLPSVISGALVVTGSYVRSSGLHRIMRLATTATVAVVGLLCVAGFPVVGEMLPFAAISTVALWVVLVVERTAAEWFLRAIWPGPRGATPAVVIDRVASDYADYADLGGMSTDTGGDYKLVATLKLGHPARGGSALARLPHVINANGAEAVIVACQLPNDQVREVLDISLTSGCEFLYPARSVEIAGRRPMLVWHQDEPFFELGAPLLKAQALILKRAVDVIGAVLGLIVLAPAFALIALLVKLDSPGPIFFWQDRAGMGGTRFRMLKFRTMHHGADEEKAQLAHLNQTGDARLFKIPNDPRVTRFGAWLRRWSIDELPQCWNVLIGNMSLVGPRPFFEADLETYEDHHFRRLDAKPGITGLWQVNGRSDVVDFEEVVRYDREYIERWSLRLDFTIMLKTIPAVFHRKGAY